MVRRIAASLLLAAALAAGYAPLARADGDPGSDVLVYQRLFLASDAGVSIRQQLDLGRLLDAAGRNGLPIRVAIIASRDDLGAVTGLWLKPRAYARFLGVELSLAYRGRLLVVMPNGIGFNWPGHPTAAAYKTLAGVKVAGLAPTTQAAVGALATASGVRLSAPNTPASASQHRSPASGGSHLDEIAALVAALLALAAAAVAVLRGRIRLPAIRRPPPRIALVSALGVISGGTIVALIAIGSPTSASSDALVRNPYLDPGTPLSGTAPAFALSDQFGQKVSLRSFRGKVVLLAFNDSECTTICPLTTTAMLEAKAMLGAAGSRVQLLGVDANPKATALQDVLSYSQLHGMLHAWHFLTGSLPQLRRVWSAYHVLAAIQGGQVDHTPALFVIGPGGTLARLYETQQSYSAIGQLGQLVAQEASRLLPDHPPVRSQLSYAQIPGIGPESPVTLPGAAGGTVQLGPGRPHLYLFFATWNRETTTLAGQLERLNGYQSTVGRGDLPRLTGVDEASVEPSPAAPSEFLRALPRRLSYPVAIDQSGRVGDGYEVQGEPWFVLTSPSGQLIWYWDVSTAGWLSPASLLQHVRAALAHTPAANAAQELAGSPRTLAAVHQQASRLLGAEPALVARVRALRGYPIVINAWASWCTPCRQEFGLFASASERYGRQVAFLGADTNDSAGDAQSFLAQHPVSYPSYQTTTQNITALAPAGLQGLPSTIFIDRAGRLAYVHVGQYASQGTLDGDIASYAR